MLDDIRQQVARDGFARAPAPDMRRMVGEAALADWPAYARSWNDLAVDQYMADNGRYRRRRFATLEARPGDIVRQPHQPHFQSLAYNRLNGGVERWFEPITEAVVGLPLSRRVLDLSLDVFGSVAAPDPGFPWRVEMHQFRIESRAGEAGRPTPEGAHRDGVDWVLVMLVARENVSAGVTNIFDPAGRSLGDFTLMEPLDAVFIDDSRVFHGVTAIEAVDPDRPAYRDVLVVTFRRRDR
ncbi:2OG-Fe dioxygenase family protein [Caulobacter sp. CCUG 60055]|uniref:2OG-Fe dioxygenase family protein n=1 Tax=Caulobacter sp. CCUG 60055 TaxID=2100090 RepID=UPI001FA7D351|nr:2OG-Fe dioxygenase family protein [Caulobacter sp. CCUG 60055]